MITQIEKLKEVKEYFKIYNLDFDKMSDGKINILYNFIYDIEYTLSQINHYENHLIKIEKEKEEYLTLLKKGM